MRNLRRILRGFQAKWRGPGSSCQIGNLKAVDTQAQGRGMPRNTIKSDGQYAGVRRFKRSKSPASPPFEPLDLRRISGISMKRQLSRPRQAGL